MADFYSTMIFRTHAKNAALIKKLRWDFSPHGSCLGVKGVTVPNQHLKFMGIQAFINALALCRPPVKPACRQSFLTKPKPLTIVTEDLNRGLAAIEKYEQTA
jgi:hypothetical protein